MTSLFTRSQQVAALDPRLGGLMASLGLSNLRALIKAIRACKTYAEERALIQKESAAIRTSFKDEDPLLRHNNIAKLLYIHMLGYPAHFGQIECLKLVATPRFTDKRLGYLGVMLLLDENTEVLTLVTNGLKNDMNHSNMYIVGLALATFGNIASEEMARDLSNEVERLMGSSNTYIRRKAAICAMRIVRKVPDLLDSFAGKAKQLLADKNHGVLLCAVTLSLELCKHEEARNEFRDVVPLLVRHLKSLVTTGYSPEHDVSGITDPFLQVKILRLLRVLGKEDPAASETMNDVLAQVASNTEASKNVGNAILYETVMTILEIEAENGLRVMAINILGKFLSNRDNNIRYVALNTLNKVVAMDTNAVQRHRNIILDCLRDGDISIRRRALELSYALINEANVRVLTRELLAFLEVADNEFKLGLTTQISLAAEKLAPNKRWHIDTMLRVLKVAGNYVREEILSSFLRLTCHTPELQMYTVQRLYSALHDDFSQESLTLASVWMIGEFGELLLQGGSMEDDELVRDLSPKAVVDLVASVLDSPYANSHVRQWVLTSLAKLAVRFSHDSAQTARIQQILGKYESSVDLELQQRSIEYDALLRRSDIRDGVLEAMPPPEIKTTMVGTVSERRSVGSTRTDKDSLLDLMGDDSTDATTSTGAGANGNRGLSSTQNTHDLLADIFGGGSDSPASASATAVQPSGKASVNDILDLFGSASVSSPPPASGLNGSGASSSLASSGLDIFGSSSASSMPSSMGSPAATAPPAAAAAAAQQQAEQKGHVAYDDKGLKITLTPRTNPARPDIVLLLATFTSAVDVTELSLQAAVPKSQKLQMLAASSTSVSPGDIKPAQQQMRILLGAPGQQVRLRLRIAFAAAGNKVQEQVDFTLPALS
ncbi:unnamed protein product [Parajaminaea phylloscopi]